MRRRVIRAAAAALVLLAVAGCKDGEVSHHHSDRPNKCAADNPYCF